MRSLPLLGLGIFFALAGLALFAFTLRQPKTPSAPSTLPKKKAELRAEQMMQTETTKLRMAAAFSAVLGAVLMLIS